MLARLLLFLGLASGAGMALAEDTEQTFGDWKITCAESQCRMSQSLVREETGEALLIARIFVNNGTPTLIVTTPLGVFLKPRLIVQIDATRARAYGFEICDSDGCHVGINLDAELLRALQRGSVAKMTLQDGLQQDVTLGISLAGFTAGMEALVK